MTGSTVVVKPISTKHKDFSLGQRVIYGHETYSSIMQFFIDEARLLDNDQLDEWLQFLADDIFYHMPIRRTYSRSEGSGFHQSANWFHDSKEALSFKVHRVLNSGSAWAEDPPSRVRRFISNLIVNETERADQFVTESYILLMRSRSDEAVANLVSAVRRDILVRCHDSWMISERTIFIDQTVLGMSNLAVFF